MMKKIKKNKGFTLLELLIVISIIGILTSIILTSLNTARDKAVIAKFRQDLGQLQNAVSLYKSNNNDSWPAAGDGGTLDELASELKTAGLYGSNTIVIPPKITSGTILSPDVRSCGQADYSSNPAYIYYFSSTDDYYLEQFPTLYNNGSPEEGFGCFEFK